MLLRNLRSQTALQIASRVLNGGALRVWASSSAQWERPVLLRRSVPTPSSVTVAAISLPAFYFLTRAWGPPGAAAANALSETMVAALSWYA